METFTCVVCNRQKPINSTSGGTGYATRSNGDKLCYECCAIQDKEYMRQHGKNTLYLTTLPKPVKIGEAVGEVINWPGTLRFPIFHIKPSRHNIAGKRYDVWFPFEGYLWHGVTYGDNTQICHVKRTKQKTK